MTTPAEDEDRATTEAARWLVALDDDPDDADLRARFAAWLAASPANAAAWANTSDVYGLMARTTPVLADRWARRAAVARPHDRFRQVRARTAAGLAALALAACLAFVVGPGLLVRLQADQATSTAEVRSLGLEDGSTVRLGPNSAIDVAYADDLRQVRLLKGEAFFDVRPDSQRPFRVAVRGVETTVLGTSFNVRFSADGAEVAVRSGLVGVDYAAARQPIAERLAAGEWVRVNWGGRVERGVMPPEEVAPWLHGQIVARDRPMADVVDELRRYYAGAIVVANGALRDRRVTGVYNLSDPVAALRAIVGAHGGSVQQLSPWLLVAFGG